MKGMSTFQTTLLGICIAIVFLAIIVFALFRGKESTTLSRVVVWGTLPAENFNETVFEANKEVAREMNITYVQKTEKEFDQALIEALASGVGPDAVFIPHDLMARQQDKFLPIPGQSYPLRQFKDTFIGQADLYITKEGLIGIPIAVDPLVMYWNRDLLFQKGVANPPKTWTEVANLVPKITEKDAAANITRTVASLGEFSNVANAKEIMATLIMQSGNPITQRDENDVLRSVLAERTIGGVTYKTAPTVDALGFYSNFSNPSKTTYAWNRALPNSRTMFLSNDLALFFSYASEFDSLINKNPNLNFDIAPMPQPADAEKNIVYGKLYGFSILKSTKNIDSIYNTVLQLTEPIFVQKWINREKATPARRDMLKETPDDPVLTISYAAALTTKAWLDPNTSETASIFKTMIESITSGRLTVDLSVLDASNKIQALLTK